MNKKALAALGLTEDATDSEIEAAGEERRENDSIVAKLEILTGQTGVDVIPSIEAWRDGAANADRIERESKAREVRYEQSERDLLCARLVSECGFSPAMVWADPLNATDTANRKPRGAWASMSLDELRAEVSLAAKHPLSLKSPSNPDPEIGDGIETLTAQELERCKQLKLDPKVFAQVKKRQAAQGRKLARARAETKEEN